MEKKHQELRLAEQSNLAAIREQVMALAQRSNNMSDSFHRDEERLNAKAGGDVRESPTPKIVQGIHMSPDKSTMPPIQPAFEMGRNMEL